MVRRTLQAVLVAGLLLGLGTAGPRAQGGGPLTFQRDDVPAIGAPRAIVSADFNGDGFPDLALGGTARASVGILFNSGREESDSHFVPGPEIVVGGGPFDLAAGDLNRDGRIDIAVANADLHAVTVLLNDPAHAFTAVLHVPVSQNPRGLAIADFDRDGIADIIVTKYQGTTVEILYGAGDGTFPTRRSHAAPGSSQGVATADFNHDGWTDAVVVGAGGHIALYEMHATGANRRDEQRPHGLNVVTTGDFDGDGWADAAMASTASSVVEVMMYRPNGALAWTGDPIAVAASPRGIAAADLNMDGALDLVTAGRAASMVTVLTRAGSGYARSDYPAHTGARAVAVGDAVRDGRIDIVTANEYGSSASLLVNQTDFGPAPGFVYQGAALPNSFNHSTFAVADFNHNGTLDIVKPNYVILDGTTRSATVIYPPSNGANGGDAGDFNGDGHDDVVYTENRGVRAFLGDGRGNFSPMSASSTGDLTPWMVQAADMNRDGRLDVVVLSSNFSTRSGLQIHLGDGNGQFSPSSAEAAARSNARSFTLGDLNGDGRMDAVLSDQSGVRALLGDGAGGWASDLPFEPDVPRYGVSLGDFTGDGILDLVSADLDTFTWGWSWGPRMTVARGNGDGTFERITQINVGPGEYVYSPMLADLNHDGELDIFTSNGHFLAGHGNGSFDAARRFAPVSFLNFLAADFNRDGLTDLLGFQHYSPDYGGDIVMLNTRTDPATNRAPVGLTQRDTVSWNYATYFYEEEESEIWAGDVTDPDLHAVRFRWTLADGTLLSTYQGWMPGPNMTPGNYEITITVDDYNGASVSDTFTLVVRPHKETVLWPQDADIHGAWQRVPDPTAAGYFENYRLTHPNANAPKLQQALATPTDYVEFGFLADPTQEYKLWIRLKAENDHWGNDSVFVQFSGATDAAGNPVYRLGTTSALAVNLEECSGCGVSGWGWEDDGWGAVNRNGTTLRFPQGGKQIIRIQTREDGVSLDQVVLSAEQYLTARPGATKNDTTIVPPRGPWIGTWWYYNQ